MVSSPGRLSRAPKHRGGWAATAAWDRNIPPLLRPLLRAYLLGYASAVVPRLLNLLLREFTAKRKGRKEGKEAETAAAIAQRSFAESLGSVLREGLEWRRFPAFCAALVGGSTLLEVPFRRLFARYASTISELSRRRLAQWLATFSAAYFSLTLLQSKRSSSTSDANAEVSPAVPNGAPPQPSAQRGSPVQYAGRTLDLTLFAATRALDVIVGELWSRRKARRVAARKWTKAESLISSLTDPAIFAASSAVIMWTWIYLPSRLPRAYNKWIASAAAVDTRLIEALRRCRDGSLRYGEDTGQAPLLQGMCEDYRWPPAWGDPATAVPFPCEMVHMGCGPSCERHALSRFARSWRWAMATYLPLNLLLVLRSPNRRGLLRAIVSASRSSAFLGAFIALFYYGVCLARTRLGPRVLGRDVAARQTIDSGVCVGSGCALCGWSILVESAGRRKDIALFVAPRALATFLPRRYPLEKQWRETLVFAFSTAVVFTCIRENPRRVRGVLGNLLQKVLAP